MTNEVSDFQAEVSFPELLQLLQRDNLQEPNPWLSSSETHIFQPKTMAFLRLTLPGSPNNRCSPQVVRDFAKDLPKDLIYGLISVEILPWNHCETHRGTQAMAIVPGKNHVVHPIVHPMDPILDAFPKFHETGQLHKFRGL